MVSFAFLYGIYKVIGGVLAERSQHKVSLEHQIVWDVETLVREDLLII